MLAEKGHGTYLTHNRIRHKYIYNFNIERYEKATYIDIFICAQLSAFGSILENDNVVKGIAKLNGKDIPIWFNITGEGTAEVGNGKNSAISQYAAGKLVIPASFINNIDKRQYKVTKIGDFAFSLCDKITEVVLEEGITEIGEHTFFGCNALNHIDSHRQKCFQRL